MNRWRSLPAQVAEIVRDETAATRAMSETSTAAMPRPPLPWGERPLRCMIGRHRPMGVWETAPPRHMFGWWTARCVRCGVSLDTMH